MVTADDARVVLSWFVAAILLGASLVFLAQPMIGKMALPRLGGSPAVWNTCMLFFQAMLLAGYAYAHRLSKIRRTGLQLLVHAGVLSLGVVLLPIGLARLGEPPTKTTPVPWLLGTLAMGVGGPFFGVASAGPLLQQWFSRTRHRHAGDPYFLFAASNAGSLLALLGYPALMEWALGLEQQRRSWSIGFAAFVAVTMVCGLVAVAWGRTVESPEVGRDRTFVSWRRRALWGLLAFVPSSLMLAVTHHLSTDVSAFPLLWIVPLALYLATFIVAYSSWGRHAVDLCSFATPLAAAGVAGLLLMGFYDFVQLQVVLHLLALFVLGLACHGRLARSRPAVEHLTTYYFWLSLGGVAGGVFNAIVAPVVFDWIAEYPIALALACMVRAPRQPGERRPRLEDFVLPFAVVPIYVGARAAATQVDPGSETVEDLVRYGVPALACLLFAGQRLRAGLAILVLLFVPRVEQALGSEVRDLFQSRTFYGVIRVGEERTENGTWHHLWHGSTKHGMQFVGEPLASMPTTYYTPSSPVGEVMKRLQKAARPRRVAVVGLGCGTMAAWGREGWSMTFYEIDPEIVRVATDPALFTYVGKSRAEISIIVGDARRRLVEASPGAYDAIVVDAFSSDAIPVHLLTREAVAMYMDRLAPGGLLVLHITNRHLDLAPVVAAIARDLDLAAVARYDDGEETDAMDLRKYSSHWAVLSRDPGAVASFTAEHGWEVLRPDPRVETWTDDYSNILSVLDW